MEYSEMETVLLTSGYHPMVLEEARRLWNVVDIAKQREALEYLRSCHELPAAACVGNIYTDDIPLSKRTDLDAWTMMSEIHKIDPDMPVIISTKSNSPRMIVDLIKAGAFDFLVEWQNPNDQQQVMTSAQETVFALKRAVQWRVMLRENQKLREDLIRRNMPDFIQGRSPVMMRVVDLIRKVAPTPATVLITGESGTGKELAARAIHALSAAKQGPFIAINCGALTDNLLASELFGHVKGAFTGADTNREGLIRQAQGGTLFLDEIATGSANFQVMLLRVLEQRRERPVGSSADYPVDCRFIAAANRDLEEMVRDGSFREDLFYRLNVFHIDIPPLRSRREDIPMLAEFFLRQILPQYAKNIKGINPAAMDLLEDYHWPGNVRQLRNAIERALISCETEYLVPADFDGQIRNRNLLTESFSDLTSYEQAMDQFERRLLHFALLRAKGNRSQAAKLLKMNRTTLNYRIKQLGLENEQ